MATGYGTQAAEIGAHLAALGCAVDFSCNAGLHQGNFHVAPGGPASMSKVYPAGTDDSGSSVIWGHYLDSKPDFVLSLYDACGMESVAPGGRPGMGWGRFGFPWVPFAMVDDGPPLAKYHRDSLAGATAILCLTHFAIAQLSDWAAATGIPLIYAPHSIDPETWKPLPKAQCKESIGIAPHRFVVAFVGVWENWPGRKGLIETVDAFSRLGREVGFDHMTLLIHSNPATEGPHPMTLVDLRDAFGIPASSFVSETTHYSIVGRSTQHMVKLYNAADVLCLPSRSEAFGLTALHAEMCGVPTITPMAHALQEVSAQGYSFKPLGDMLSWKLSRWVQVGAEPVLECMRAAYLDGHEKRERLGTWSRERAIEFYSNRAVRPHWEEALDKLASLMRSPSSVSLPQSFQGSDVAVIIPTVPEEDGTVNTRLQQIVESWEAQGARVVVVDDSRRSGYPVAINAGTRMVPESVRHLVLWNDDCVPDDGLLKALTSAAAKHGLALVAPVITRVEGDRNETEMAWELYHGGVRPIQEPWVEGAKYQPLGGVLYQSLFMVERETWEWLGGFDERYAPGYYEDADFVRRLTASGYKAGVVTDARAIHFSGSTFRRLYTEAERSAITRRNRRFYSWKFGE